MYKRQSPTKNPSLGRGRKRVQRFRGKSHSAKKVRKADRRMRTSYKGLLGDSINVKLAAAAYNFKRAMNALLCLLERLLIMLAERCQGRKIQLKIADRSLSTLTLATHPYF